VRQAERRLAEWHQEIDSYRLEQRHFGRYLERQELPDLADFPLLRRSSGRILDYLLVTNHSMLPTSRNLRDLIGYIEYHDQGETVDSAVVSVFDLLYRDYSARLQPLARRLETSRPYKSENIMLTLLHEILAEDPYTDCLVACQVLLRNLLPDLARLTPEQAAYARRRASIDFVIYNKIAMQLALAIEVDGFEFHENNPAQQVRDSLKNAICAVYGRRLRRLPTTGSGEADLIRRELDAALGVARSS
jgi:hypothetical protein